MPTETTQTTRTKKPSQLRRFLPYLMRYKRILFFDLFCVIAQALVIVFALFHEVFDRTIQQNIQAASQYRKIKQMQQDLPPVNI